MAGSLEPIELVGELPPQTVTLGVIADTHIPDRARRLHPHIIPLFKEARVAAILHAGDVSSPSVLDQLGRVAPVYAVRGNRDWVWLRSLPRARLLTIEGITIGLTHGHGRWWNYLADRVRFLLHGYRLAYFVPRLLAAFPDARVIVFGHTHRPLNQWMDGHLLFNPGSPHFPDSKNLIPSVGLLQLSAGGEVKGEIVALN